MRGGVCLVVLCLANTMTFAQSVERPSSPIGKSAEEIKAIEERVAYWRTTCLQDWDVATHMTRTEWRTTCERVATERRVLLLQMEGKPRQR